MDIKDFKDYTVADISEDEVVTIKKLEEVLSDKVNQDIVLIAYSPNSKVKA